MLIKFLVALGVWIIVSLVLALLGGLLLHVGQQVTTTIGQFLKDSSMILGFIAGLAYFIWGPPPSNLRPRI